MINKLKQFCNRINIPVWIAVVVLILTVVSIAMGREFITMRWVRIGLFGIGAVVGLVLAYYYISEILEWLIKIFEWLTNKLKPPCNKMGIPVRLAATVISLVAVYILITFVPVVMKWTHIVEWMRNGLLGIGAITGLYIAYYRSHAIQKQADIAEKRYASEQFSQSVTLLAKDNKDGTPAIEARIGGGYALAQLAEADSKQYGAQVMKALVAYIRNNAQRTALPSEKDRNKSTPIPEKFSAPYPEERLDAAHLGEDVKTAFAELKRLHSNGKVCENSGVKDEDLSFSHTDFRALRLNEIEWIEEPDLSHANLSGANLISANLECAKLHKAKLQGAYLGWANLQGANLQEANLQGTQLVGANLQGADLNWTKLQDGGLGSANLQGANLYCAELKGANLCRANLQGADFRDAVLQNTRVAHAIAIYTTFEYTIFDKSTKFDDSVKEWKVWHDNDSLLPERGAQPLELNAEWDLALIFPKKIAPSDVVFVLEGTLRNFAQKGDNKPGPRAIECRKAVKQWVTDHKLWERLSGDWREWLKSLDDEGRASDDEYV